jgi:hypothetical protein
VCDEQAQPAHIVKQSGGIGQIHMHQAGAGHFLGKQCGSQRVTPAPAQFLDLEGPLKVDPRGHCHAERSHAAQAQHYQRVLEAADLGAEAEQGGIGAAQDLGGEGRIGAQRLDDLADGHVVVGQQV